MCWKWIYYLNDIVPYTYWLTLLFSALSYTPWRYAKIKFFTRVFKLAPWFKCIWFVQYQSSQWMKFQLSVLISGFASISIFLFLPTTFLSLWHCALQLQYQMLYDNLLLEKSPTRYGFFMAFGAFFSSQNKYNQTRIADATQELSWRQRYSSNISQSGTMYFQAAHHDRVNSVQKSVSHNRRLESLLCYR